MNTRNRRAYIELISAMSIYGSLGLLSRCLDVPSALLALVRGIVGMIFLLVLMRMQGRHLNWKDIRDNLFWLLASGAALGLDWILLFETYRYTTVAAATLCYYTAPVMVILAAAVLFREKITFRKGICAVISLVGMAFASGIFQPGGVGNTQTKGILLGLLAAMLYAVMILINRKLRHVNAYDRAVTQLAAASLVLIPYNLTTVDFESITFTPQTVVLLLIAGVVHTGIAYALYFSAMESLSAQSLALTSYVDPIVAVLVSALVLREPLSNAAILGAVLVLGSMIVSELEGKPFRSRKIQTRLLRAAFLHIHL